MKKKDIELVFKGADEQSWEELLDDLRPKGQWIGNAFDEHHCSRCGHPALWEEEPDDYYEVQSRFCPNCGAIMKGDNNG